MNMQVESPKNFQQKCLCVLLLDVSGSMRRTISENSDVKRIDRLNEGVARFYDDIINRRGGVSATTKDQLEVAIIKFDQEPIVIRKPKLLEFADQPPILTERGSTTETVKGIEKALDVINERKRFYCNTGQSYYRPWIVLITDGNPSCPQHDIDNMAERLNHYMKKKQINMIGVSVVDNVNQETMSKLSGGHNVALKDFRFTQFFRWLSNSFSTITKSGEDGGYDISGGKDEWMNHIPE